MASNDVLAANYAALTEMLHAQQLQLARHSREIAQLQRSQQASSRRVPLIQKLLKADDIHSWRDELTRMLDRYDLARYIRDDVPGPRDDSPARRKWSNDRLDVNQYIQATVPDHNVWNTLRGRGWSPRDSNPKETFDYVIQHFERCALEALANLHCELVNARCKDFDTLASFTTRINLIKERLEASDFKMADKAYVWLVLKGVASEYPELHARCVDRNQTGTLTWTDLLAELQAQAVSDSRRDTHATTSNMASAAGRQQSGIASEQDRTAPQSGSSSSRVPPPNPPSLPASTQQDRPTRKITSLRVLAHSPHSDLSGAKRALLIGAPFGELSGPSRDVGAMSALLEGLEFDITTCCGEAATRKGIRQAWLDLIQKTSPNDVVVIFYSGHGGLVEAPRDRRPDNGTAATKPRQYQFLVPIDYGESKDGDFRGILDVELSHLLRDTTDATDNVTLILDCCHAGRMARDPTHGSNARPKQLLEIQHHDIAAWIKHLREQGQLTGDASMQGNEKAVRIVAAATRETAWEYRNANGEWAGALTEALARAVEEARGQRVSWNTTLVRVGEIVSSMFPQQHPEVEGPNTRQHFSLQTLESLSLPVTVENGTAILRGGRVAGVREGNVYSVLPLEGKGKQPEGATIGEATVTDVMAFRARVDLRPSPGASGLPQEGGLAVLRKEALYEWPVKIPEHLTGLREAVNASKFLRRHQAEERAPWLAEFCREDHNVIILRTAEGVEIGSLETDEENPTARALAEIVKRAETLGKAQHLLGLKCGQPGDLLEHELHVDFGTVVEGVTRPVQQDGGGIVQEEDRVYISLRNDGGNALYVLVFDVNVAGKVHLFERSVSTKGRELRPGDSYTFGIDRDRQWLEGFRVAWPDSVPKTQPVGERLVFVLTSSPVDLGHLATRDPSPVPRGLALSRLEMLTSHLASGTTRDVEETARGPQILYDTIEVPFSISRREVLAAQLPEPENLEMPPESDSSDDLDSPESASKARTVDTPGVDPVRFD